MLQLEQHPFKVTDDLIGDQHGVGAFEFDAKAPDGGDVLGKFFEFRQHGMRLAAGKGRVTLQSS